MKILKIKTNKREGIVDITPKVGDLVKYIKDCYFLVYVQKAFINVQNLVYVQSQVI